MRHPFLTWMPDSYAAGAAARVVRVRALLWLGPPRTLGGGGDIHSYFTRPISLEAQRLEEWYRHRRHVPEVREERHGALETKSVRHDQRDADCGSCDGEESNYLATTPPAALSAFGRGIWKERCWLWNHPKTCICVPFFCASFSNPASRHSVPDCSA